MILSSRSGNVASIIIVILVFSVVGGYVFLTNQYVPSNIAVVTLDTGFNDRSFADQAGEGLYMTDVVVNLDIRLAVDLDDAQDIMENIARGGRHDLIIVIGTDPDLHARVQTVATEFVGQKFALIGGEVALDNVASATFALDEAAFLGGALAAYASVETEERNGIVGIIGSVETDPTVQSLIDGFLQGLQYANASQDINGTIRLLPTEYVGSYNDTSTAESIARDMFDPDDGNATVIFAPVRASIMGIRAAMEWANLTYHIEFGNDTTREPFVIGAEAIQDYLGNPSILIASGPSWVIGSVVPRSGLAVYRILNATLWDDFPGGLENGGANHTIGSLSNNGVGLLGVEEFRNDSWVTDYMLNVTADYRQGIINGTIVVT
jgi:basic membrane lipoprotein Med (substrate-binding protein (PBP1-ABC) superfamily)